MTFVMLDNLSQPCFQNKKRETILKKSFSLVGTGSQQFESHIHVSPTSTENSRWGEIILQSYHGQDLKLHGFLWSFIGLDWGSMFSMRKKERACGDSFMRCQKKRTVKYI